MNQTFVDNAFNESAPKIYQGLERFAARKKIAPQIELFPMSELNEAIERLHSGQARYRIVLKADFAE